MPELNMTPYCYRLPVEIWRTALQTALNDIQELYMHGAPAAYLTYIGYFRVCKTWRVRQS
jgi:hypothetical protein